MYVPSPLEQGKIAGFLDLLDTQIDAQSEQVSKLQQQKRGLMQRLLTGEVRVAVDG